MVLPLLDAESCASNKISFERGPWDEEGPGLSREICAKNMPFWDYEHFLWDCAIFSCAFCTYLWGCGALGHLGRGQRKHPA